MIQLNSQITILIADRNLSEAQEIAASLKQQGYRVVGVVNSGEQALECATFEVPDIVLMDLSLSGLMDGITAGWKIYNELNCPVVYMTTDEEHDILWPGVKLAAVWGRVVKPFTAEAVVATIEATLADYHQLRRATTANTVKTTMQPVVRSIQLVTSPVPAILNCQDESFLQILAMASQMEPAPRLFFEDGVLVMLTSTAESARSLSAFCRAQEVVLPFQIFIWRWQECQYLPYDSVH